MAHGFSPSKRSLADMLLSLCLCIALVGCGYTWRGQEGSLSENSVLGTGTSTLKLRAVEQPTLYTWLPYEVRTKVRNSITERGLARWVDEGPADYTLTIKINSFRVRSYGEYHSQNLLYEGVVNMEFIVADGKTNTETWRSGPVYYSDTFQNLNEESAIREVVDNALRRCLDRLQQRF